MCNENNRVLINMAVNVLKNKRVGDCGCFNTPLSCRECPYDFYRNSQDVLCGALNKKVLNNISFNILNIRNFIDF